MIGIAFHLLASFERCIFQKSQYQSWAIFNYVAPLTILNVDLIESLMTITLIEFIAYAFEISLL